MLDLAALVGKNHNSSYLAGNSRNVPTRLLQSRPAKPHPEIRMAKLRAKAQVKTLPTAKEEAKEKAKAKRREKATATTNATSKGEGCMVAAPQDARNSSNSSSNS